ncbi:MAG: hypothetical protein EOO39_38785 [Cytophagaceae bacterium]|nr:MAG: hypothetical protein EOO39_38785 [Cytophagaceae bacterium]
MRLNQRITSLIGTTTLDPRLVKGFLQTPPQYHQWGVRRQFDQPVLDQLKATDLFEFYLRLYLSGRHKTLHAVLRQVGVFTSDDPIGAAWCIGYSLTQLRQQLLRLEWYELLLRLDIAQGRIGALMPWGACSGQPAVANLLDGFTW